SQLQRLVASGQVRYFLLAGGGSGGQGGGSANSALTQWVTNSCAAVSSSAYSGASGSTAGDSLYVCGAP
ncbi:MAG TPA: hypothetical protein VID72_08270, partial [Ktedonobacterales bacterium]